MEARHPRSPLRTFDMPALYRSRSGLRSNTGPCNCPPWARWHPTLVEGRWTSRSGLSHSLPHIRLPPRFAVHRHVPVKGSTQQDLIRKDDGYSLTVCSLVRLTLNAIDAVHSGCILRDGRVSWEKFNWLGTKFSDTITEMKIRERDTTPCSGEDVTYEEMI